MGYFNYNLLEISILCYVKRVINIRKVFEYKVYGIQYKYVRVYFGKGFIKMGIV